MTDTLGTENIQMSDFDVSGFDFDDASFDFGDAGFDFDVSDCGVLSGSDCGVSLILPVCTICRAGV